MTYRNLFSTLFSLTLISAVPVSAEDAVPTAPSTAPAPAPAEPAKPEPAKPEAAKPEAAKPADAAKTADPAVKPAATTETAPAPAPAAPAADPYGFTYWLNSVRAQYGLAPVGYDPNLAGWAAVNNQHQASRGMGHFVMGPARRQNCAMGNYAVVGAMWMASPAHQAALLDPSITYIGIAGYGAYWTFNAY